MTAWKITEIRDRELETEAAALYSSALPYHNFVHVLTTIRASGRIIRQCMLEGIRVDPQVVYLALLFHDAGYHQDHKTLGYDSKEAYSADLAIDCLRRRKLPAASIRKIAGAILSTRRDAKFITSEQKAVRAADLSGLAANYVTFRDNTLKLKAEHEILTSGRVSWQDWLPHVCDTVRFYSSQQIRLTSYFVNDNGESKFQRAVRRNLRRLEEER